MGLQLVLIGIGRLQQASAARKAPNSPCARLLPALSMVLLRVLVPMYPSIYLSIDLAS